MRNNASPLWGGVGMGVARLRSDVEVFARVIHALRSTPLRHLPTPHPALPHKGGRETLPSLFSRPEPAPI